MINWWWLIPVFIIGHFSAWALFWFVGLHVPDEEDMDDTRPIGTV